jgi:hypothetical protein
MQSIIKTARIIYSPGDETSAYPCDCYKVQISDTASSLLFRFSCVICLEPKLLEICGFRLNGVTTDQTFCSHQLLQKVGCNGTVKGEGEGEGEGNG